MCYSSAHNFNKLSENVYTLNIYHFNCNPQKYSKKMYICKNQKARSQPTKSTLIGQLQTSDIAPPTLLNHCRKMFFDFKYVPSNILYSKSKYVKVKQQGQNRIHLL